MESVKSTVNISSSLRAELDRYVALKIVPSFSSGVNNAIKAYVKELRRIEYDKQMEEAANDKDFMQRTMDCHLEMTSFDSEVTGEW